MSIGIYGDSFASTRKETYRFAWYNLLAEKLNTHVYNYEDNIYNTYGHPATSTFFSYKKFLKYHDKHEYNIFVASDSGKYTKFVDLHVERGPVPVPGINSLEWHINDTGLRYDAKEKLENIKAWLLVSDDEFMHTVQELILQDMERKAGKNLIILASDIDQTYCEARKETSCANFGLWALANQMYKDMGVTDETRKYVLDEKKDKISCHLSEETNHVLADLLYNHIKTGEKMIMPQTIPHKHTWQYYFG